MTDSHNDPSSTLEQRTLNSHQHRQPHSIIDDPASTGGKPTIADIGPRVEAHGEDAKDQIDDAIAKGPKKADEHTGGRVSVAETGDLHDLAARRASVSATHT